MLTLWVSRCYSRYGCFSGDAGQIIEHFNQFRDWVFCQDAVNAAIFILLLRLSSASLSSNSRAVESDMAARFNISSSLFTEWLCCSSLLYILFKFSVIWHAGTDFRAGYGWVIRETSHCFDVSPDISEFAFLEEFVNLLLVPSPCLFYLFFSAWSE